MAMGSLTIKVLYKYFYKNMDWELWLMKLSPKIRNKKIFRLCDRLYSPVELIDEVKKDTPIGRYIKSAGIDFLYWLLAIYEYGENDIIKNYIRYWVKNMPYDMANKVFISYGKYGDLTPNRILEEIEKGSELGKKLYERELYVIKALGKLRRF